MHDQKPITDKKWVYPKHQWVDGSELDAQAILGLIELYLYLEHLFDFLSWQVDIEFMQKLKNLIDA